MKLIAILIVLSCLLSGCAGLKLKYDKEGKIEEVWSTGVQDTEITQEKEGVKTTVKRKAAFQLWPENLFTIYKD